MIYIRKCGFGIFTIAIKRKEFFSISLLLIHLSYTAPVWSPKPVFSTVAAAALALHSGVIWLISFILFPHSPFVDSTTYCLVATGFFVLLHVPPARLMPRKSTLIEGTDCLSVSALVPTIQLTFLAWTQKRGGGSGSSRNSLISFINRTMIHTRAFRPIDLVATRDIPGRDVRMASSATVLLVCCCK